MLIKSKLKIKSKEKNYLFNLKTILLTTTEMKFIFNLIKYNQKPCQT